MVNIKQLNKELIELLVQNEAILTAKQQQERQERAKAKANKPQGKKAKVNCIVCSKSFTAKSNKSKFCGNICKCKYAYYKGKIPEPKSERNPERKAFKMPFVAGEEINCSHCHKRIPKKTWKTKFCGEKCRLDYRSKELKTKTKERAKLKYSSEIPNCKSISCPKDGTSTGIQRYYCKKCSRRFKLEYTQPENIHIKIPEIDRKNCLYCGISLGERSKHLKGRKKRYCSNKCKHRYLCRVNKKYNIQDRIIAWANKWGYKGVSPDCITELKNILKEEQQFKNLKGGKNDK